MSENAKSNKKRNETSVGTVISLVITVLATVAGLLANFIKYLHVYSWFGSWKVSIYSYLMSSIDNSTWIQSPSHTIEFFVIVLGILFGILAVIFAGTKKMTPVIVFSALAILMFIVTRFAWLHYASYGLAIIGAIWYKIARNRSIKASDKEETDVSV